MAEVAVGGGQKGMAELGLDEVDGMSFFGESGMRVAQPMGMDTIPFPVSQHRQCWWPLRTSAGWSIVFLQRDVGIGIACGDVELA